MLSKVRAFELIPLDPKTAIHDWQSGTSLAFELHYEAQSLPTCISQHQHAVSFVEISIIVGTAHLCVHCTS